MEPFVTILLSSLTCFARTPSNGQSSHIFRPSWLCSPNPKLHKTCRICLAWLHDPSDTVDLLDDLYFTPPHHLSPRPKGTDAFLELNQCQERVPRRMTMFSWIVGLLSIRKCKQRGLFLYLHRKPKLLCFVFIRSLIT